MFESLLIANRGEIARRVIRTARRLGIRTIAVYSAADARAPFVREADECVAIGPAPARDSYLNGSRLLEAARITHARAIHPGYGFLSENAQFAESVREAGLIWVGAPSAAIRAMGAKDAAKQTMLAAGVPVTPGYLGARQDVASLEAEATHLGFPVLIKAVAGGGGKGMRRVEAAKDFVDALSACRREARAAFGDERVLIEKYIRAPRHLEVQVFADQHGNVVHLFERECSLQRRHQKVIEEAPAPGMDPALRAHLCSLGVAAAKAVGYVGAGTIEFIADGSEGLRADRIWFMEMNTRLQVEHAVTEVITGEDLVEWQLRVANGEKLPRRQADITMHGWSMEARLYAENPATGFLPATGRLQHLRLPAEVRVDSGVDQGGEISPYYDPLIAKLIVHGIDRQDARARLHRACAAIEIWPLHNNAAFLARLTASPAFIHGAVDTDFIERHFLELVREEKPDELVRQAAARALSLPRPNDPWAALYGWRLNAEPCPDVRVFIDEHPCEVRVDPESPAARAVEVEGVLLVFASGRAWRVAAAGAMFAKGSADGFAHSGMSADGLVRSPMPGRVVSLTVTAGQSVVRGQGLIVLEAMKMEHVLVAPFDGTVREVAVETGAQVMEGVVLVGIERH